MGTPKPIAKYLCEFVGTFLLVFTVGSNVLSEKAVWGGIAIGNVLMVSIYGMGGISGGNFNPAVSLSLGISKAMGGPGMDIPEVLKYIAVQCAGGLTAAYAYTGLHSDHFDVGPQGDFKAWHAEVCELLYTFMLCFVVLNVAAASSNKPNQFYGLAIGYVIVAGAFGAGYVSGGCFNPAVALGIDASSDKRGFGWCGLYTVFEMAGAALAAVLFRVVRPQEFGGEPSLISVLVSEFLGTFMLVLTVGLNVQGDSKAGAYSIAASLMCMIYALGNVSGAHFNPAVTLAALVSGRCPDLTPVKALQYIGTQLVAGILAGATCSSIHGSFKLGARGVYGDTEVAVAETIFTFVLCYVVLAVAVSTRTKSSEMFGLAIGACVTVGGNAIGPISGGSLNPAVSFGIQVPCMVQGCSIMSAFFYTFFELLGGLLAAAVFIGTHAVDTANAAK